MEVEVRYCVSVTILSEIRILIVVFQKGDYTLRRVRNYYLLVKINVLMRLLLWCHLLTQYIHYLVWLCVCLLRTLD